MGSQVHSPLSKREKIVKVKLRYSYVSENKVADFYITEQNSQPPEAGRTTKMLDQFTIVQWDIQEAFVIVVIYSFTKTTTGS